MSRREFMARLAALSTAAWASPLWVPNFSQALARTLATAANPAGTTLERSIVTTGEGPYFRLTFGPGWPMQIREDLAQPHSGREDRRVALATVLHFTDFQFPDAQSPARVEFLDRTADDPSGDIPFQGAFRPGEALVLQVCEAMIRQANAVGGGPITGRPYDCCVSTGDNFDNKQFNELMWFLGLMNGRSIAANSGDPDVFEGVQSFDDVDTYDPHYYHPEVVDDPRAPDNYKHFYGFPDFPGLLDAAIQSWQAEGLDTPWYSVYGNHDALVQGNEASNPFYEEVAVGSVKILGPPPGWAPGDFWRGLMDQDPDALAAFHLAPAAIVTPDEDRRIITGREYVERHLAEASGPGPAGHGFTQQNAEEATLFYTFEIVPGIVGIVLDTTSPRLAVGSIPQSQLDWLEERLIEHSGRYFDGDTQVSTGNEDHLIVLFTHHRIESFQWANGAAVPDEEGRVEPRYDATPLREILHRFPNLILWVNGHSHYNRIVPRPDPAGRTQGFWDITTAAQVDPPQQARIIEIADNRDGTLSIFTTVVDHAAPPQAELNPSVLTLASIGRELSFNDYQLDVGSLIGEAEDLNTELIIAAPFEFTPVAAPAAEETDPVPLPATGGGALVGIGVTAATAALGAAVAFRRRGEAPEPPEREQAQREA